MLSYILFVAIAIIVVVALWLLSGKIATLLYSAISAPSSCGLTNIDSAQDSYQAALNGYVYAKSRGNIKIPLGLVVDSDQLNNRILKEDEDGFWVV